MPNALRPALLFSALGLAVCGAASAQDYGQPGGPPPPPPPPYYPAPAPVPGPGYAAMFANLSDQPGAHSGFVFDRSMMQVAQGVLEQEGLDTRRAAAAVTGISVDNYSFPRPAFYIPEAMAALTESFRAGGWSHLVDQGQSTRNSAQPLNTLTDVWLHHHGADFDAVTVLRRGPRQMNVLQLTGDLRPLDLVHISGHFGIPKVDTNTVMVPAP